MLPGFCACLQMEHTPGRFTAQLLLQAETDMLLNLAVQQLAATIPDSFPGAHAAQTWICQLYCGSLYSLYSHTDLHKLPRLAAYTGPQVALQLQPSPFRPQQLLLLQQQEGQQQQEQPAELCVLAPTVPLLTELLPLLMRHCLTQQQWHQEQQQQLQQHELPSFLAVVCPNLLSLRTMLMCSVVPSFRSTAGAAAAAAAAAAAPASAPAAEGTPLAAQAAATQAAVVPVNSSTDGCAYTICGEGHGVEILMQHAIDIISHFEAALRLDAELVDAATAAAAARSAAAVTAAAGSVSLDLLNALSLVFVRLFYPTADDSDYEGKHPSPLVMLACCEGPGSQVDRQLHSLLATIVKLSGWGMGKLTDVACVQYSLAAVCGASAVLDAIVEKQQRQQQQEQGQQQQLVGAAADRSNRYTAVDALASVVIMGRCCMQWAAMQIQAAATLTQQQQQQHDAYVSPVQQVWRKPSWQINVCELMLSAQEWFTTGSTCDQLAAAGYAPLPVLQQLEQLLATYQALRDSPPDTVAPLLTAAQQLHSTGLALCSFAVPCMCNNPGCTSMAGLSELAAVSGRSCICAGCCVARYCGRACQRAAWKRHKPVCGALSAAAAAAAAGGAAAAGATV
jgi:hypothetical protein